MRNKLFLLFLGAGLAAGFGCGDDSSTGGGGAGAGGNGAGATGAGGNGNGGTEQGGNGGNAQGGNAQGGQNQGGTNTEFNCDPPTGEPPALTPTVLTQVDSGVMQIRSAPGTPDRLFIVGQGGVIYIYENGALLDTPFLDIHTEIRAGGEEGLLGLTFHPDYAANGRFFVHYSQDGDGASTVMEYKVSADPNVADPTPVQLVLQHPTAQINHNGGAVEFGDDGFLYISLGDGGTQCDPECDALDTSNLLGKIMRVDVDGTPDGSGYPAAPGNPDNAKYYHIGMRNPWRISFDGCTGDLYIGDVGQGSYEEVDVITQAMGAQNLGWPYLEALHDSGCDVSECSGEPANPLAPIAEYDHGQGCAVAGGVVYRGTAIPGLRGWYFYGDNCSGFVRILSATNGALTAGPQDTGASVDGLASFGQDGHGEVYAGSVDGTVYRIDAE